MGSYINIGLIAKKTCIKNSVMFFLNELNSFKFKSVFFPRNNNYNEWISLSDTECSIDDAFEYLNKYEMSYFIGEFKINNKIIDDIEFSIEKSCDNLICFIIQMPDNEIINCIDECESDIIELLNRAKGFSFAFCDSEAHLGDERYSIYVEYLDEPKFVFNNWKIDGLTERL